MVNNVLKEPAASFFRVEGGGTWYKTISTLNMETACSSDSLITIYSAL
jgi:hypothetical protein